MIGAVLTNEPRQRGLIQLVSTLYSYLTPLATMLFISLVLLPKYDNVYSTELLSTLTLYLLPITFVMVLLSIISLNKVDKPEQYMGLKNDYELEKIGWQDVWNLLMRDCSFQKLLSSLILTKFAQQISGQAILATMLFGIVLGNYQLGTLINTISLLPSLLIGFYLLRYIEKFGTKKFIVFACIVNVVILSLGSVHIFFSTPIISLQSPFFTIIFAVLQLLSNATNMAIIIANGMLKNDMIDYELYRTGKYFPAVINGVFNFVDQFISSFTTVIIAVSISFIGYQSTVPQPSDTFTGEIKTITVILYYLVPVLCNLVAMYIIKTLRMDKHEIRYVQQRLFQKKNRR